MPAPNEVVEQTQEADLDESANFQDILGDIGGEEAEPAPAALPTAVTPPATPPPTPAAASVVPSSPAPPAVPPAAAVPAQAQPQAEIPSPGAQVAPTPAPPAGTPQPPADIETVRQKALEEMTTSFALSKEDKEAMMLSDEGAIVMQRMAANVTLRTYENVMASIMQMLPGFIRNVTGSQTANEKLWNDFFSSNPHLKGHEAKVYDLATNYRQMNPRTPADQLMKEIAALAVVRLGLAPVPAEVPVQTAPPPAAPRPPAQPPRPPAAPAGVGGLRPNMDSGVPEYIDELLNAELN